MYGRSSTAPLPGSSPQTEQAAIWLEGRGARLYDPGETLSGFYSLSEIRRAAVDSVEISVLWRTEGKGNEDVGVHAFWKLSVQAGDWIDPLRPCRFSTKLPKSPLSYEGNLIKICWYARIRAFLSTGEQVVDETPFRLGDLPDMRALKLYADHDS